VEQRLTPQDGTLVDDGWHGVRTHLVSDGGTIDGSEETSSKRSKTHVYARWSGKKRRAPAQAIGLFLLI
jgi:hypothetical protein